MVYRDPPRVPLYPVQLDFRTIIALVGDSKALGRSLSESTGLRPHAASVKIDRLIFALASGLKQLAKASCGSPGCLTRCSVRQTLEKRRFGRPRLAVRHTAQSRSKSVLYDECRTGGAFDPPMQHTINTCIYVRSCC